MMKELKPKLSLLTVTEPTFVNSLPKIDLMTATFDEASESRLQLLMEKIQEMQTQRLVSHLDETTGRQVPTATSRSLNLGTFKIVRFMKISRF